MSMGSLLVVCNCLLLLFSVAAPAYAALEFPMPRSGATSTRGRTPLRPDEQAVPFL